MKTSSHLPHPPEFHSLDGSLSPLLPFYFFLCTSIYLSNFFSVCFLICQIFHCLPITVVENIRLSNANSYNKLPPHHADLTQDLFLSQCRSSGSKSLFSTPSRNPGSFLLLIPPSSTCGLQVPPGTARENRGLM